MRDGISTATNQFSVRATGGVRIVTNNDTPVTGCSIPAGGGSWQCSSDRNAKANFAAVGSRSVLERVAAMPIQVWNYKSQQADIKHIGPMAQDFAAAFGVGENDTTISMVDADGVALAAIQGLYTAGLEKDQQIAALKQQVATLGAEKDQQIAALQERLAAVEQAQQPVASSGVSMQLLILAMAVTGLGACLLSGLALAVLLRRRQVLPALR